MTTKTDYAGFGDIPGYQALFQHLAAIVEQSPDAPLAAAGLLNAAAMLMLGVVGPEITADTLRRAADHVPMAETAARGRLS